MVNFKKKYIFYKMAFGVPMVMAPGAYAPLTPP